MCRYPSLFTPGVTMTSPPLTALHPSVTSTSQGRLGLRPTSRTLNTESRRAAQSFFGPSLQSQKEGSPWIFGANGQWNYDITGGGLSFKNFNFSLSLFHQF